MSSMERVHCLSMRAFKHTCPFYMINIFKLSKKIVRDTTCALTNVDALSDSTK